MAERLLKEDIEDGTSPIQGEERQKTANIVLDRFEKMKASRADFESIWDEGVAAWNSDGSDSNNDKESWQAKVYVPLTQAIIESALAEMIEQRSKVDLLPQEERDVIKAKVMKEILDFTWDKGNAELQRYFFDKDLLIFGTAIGYEYFREDKKTVQELIEVKNGKKKYKSRKITEFSDVYWEHIPIYNFFIDETATSMENARDCIHRRVMNVKDFKREYRDNSMASKVLSGGDVSFDQRYQPYEALDADEIEVLIYWNQAIDQHIVCANGIVVLDEPIPYVHKKLPFFHSVDVAFPGKFYGKGEPAIIKTQQAELNALNNMMLDNVHLTIHKMWKIAEGSGIDESELLSRPGGAIYMNDISQLQPIEFSDIKSSTFNAIDRTREDAVRGTGIDDRQQSVASGGGTATEAAILKEATFKRIKLKLFLFEEMALKRQTMLRISNVQQHYSVPKVEEIVGEELARQMELRPNAISEINGKTVVTKFPTIRVSSIDGQPTFFEATPDSIRGEFDIKITAGSTQPVSRELEKQKFLQFIQTAGNTEPIATQINWQFIAIEAAKLFDLDPLKVLSQGPPVGAEPEGQELLPEQAEIPAQAGSASPIAENIQDIIPGFDANNLGQSISEPGPINAPAGTLTP